MTNQIAQKYSCEHFVGVLNRATNGDEEKS
jgi:hypothetical protein